VNFEVLGPYQVGFAKKYTRNQFQKYRLNPRFHGLRLGPCILEIFFGVFFVNPGMYRAFLDRMPGKIISFSARIDFKTRFLMGLLISDPHSKTYPSQ
jgi:hypothetical protein